MDVETEWMLVAKLRASIESQDPSAKNANQNISFNATSSCEYLMKFANLFQHPNEGLETDDFTLRRFLRARGHDINKAASLFLKFKKWRREWVPNGFISESEIKNELEQQKVYMQGLDRMGRPIFVCFGAKHNYSKRQMDELKRFVTYNLDKACSRMPSGQEKFICIADLKGWGYWNCDIRAYLAALEIMQNYYPERLGKYFLVNVPYIFMKTWKFIYPFIDKNTREKFVFVDSKKLKETLLLDIEETQLPEIYGGKLPLIPIENA